MINGKSITDVMGEAENGQFITDLTDELYDVVKAVMEQRKPGTISINLAFIPTGRSVAVAASFKGKKPEEPRPSTTFFVSDDGALMRDDPRQPKLPLREVVDNSTGEIRDVADQRA